MINSTSPLNGAHPSQHANLRVLRGTQPGLLDPSQPSRLLRSPDSTLSFASFDPKTALAEEPSTQKPDNSGSLVPPKRIVIETTSKGASFWRFVPRARLEEGVQDEGVWPRVIDICGEKVHCYQEQWEIYKLDFKYHCVVYPWPKCSTVTGAELPNQDFQTADIYSSKRSRWPSPEAAEPAAQKKARSRPPEQMDGASSFESDEDEDEVEEMIIDEPFSQKPKSSRRPNSTRRDDVKKARRDRWAKNRVEKPVQDTTVSADGSFSMRIDTEETLSFQNAPRPTEENPKRKGDPFPESDNDSDRMICDNRSPRGHKRARTLPSKTRNGVSWSRVSYEKKRVDRLRQHAELNRQYQERKNAKSSRFTFVPPESVSEVKDDEASPSTTETHSQAKDDSEETPVESFHEGQIAKSIRKLRELEKDRPIWEAHRKQREVREHAEEQERLAKAERRRKEEEQRLREEREAAEREKQRAQQEAERLAREELQQRQRRQRQRWESGPWTTHRALERYRMLSDEFDATKFTSGVCLTFHDIPWPVLHAPSRLAVEDVDWSAVETFFATVKSHMRLQDYKEFVEKSHRRFHPDRWRARKIWTAVTDEEERGYLEVAANTVAQAITPIWRAVKEG